MPSKIFCIPLVKFLTTFRSFYAPQVLPHAPVTTFFASFLVIYLHFLRKLVPWMPPKVDAQGRGTVRIPLCTLLSVALVKRAIFNT